VPVTPTPLLFLHGFWHGAWCWNLVLPHVAATGRPALAVDMAGHGLRARRPETAYQRPFDLEAYASERSPVADVDLDQAGDLLVSQIKQLGQGGPVVVVAHSMGGTVLTRAVQQEPGLVAHAVYLAALMPASGVPAGMYSLTPEYAGDLLSPCNIADALAVGAARIDTASYRAQLREALYADVDTATADAAIGLLTPDAPIGIPIGTTTLTADGWGAVPRTYVLCTQDRALPPAMQRRFIADADAAFPDNPTSVVTLDASHSPFLSMPEQVADIVTRL
jgi:pimeloyl-ACP methyl ester carboxylesterase